jgi:Ca-activated chloride channel homolog
MMRNKSIIIVFLLLALQILFTDSLRISQIDTTSMLFNQKVKLYLSITDDNGDPVKNLEEQMFKVFESADNTQFQQNKIVDFETNSNITNGINFLLLIDNSGSMYLDMNGKRTNEQNKKRIFLAKSAVRDFIESVNNPNDKIGIAEYNTNYQNYSKPVQNKERILNYLNEIQEPATPDEKYTEIYASLHYAVDDFKRTKGRKVIIILSDGENMPYYQLTQKEHQVYGKKIFTFDEPIMDCLKEGISVFTVNFGNPYEKKDRNLTLISLETGGAVFNAYDKEQLKNVYLKINNQVVNEYLLTYGASMEPSDKKYVKVEYLNKSKKTEVTRFYFSSPIFGMPMKNFNPLLLLILLLALLFLWLLSLIKFKKVNVPANIEVLATQIGRPVTKLVTLNKSGKTIIGGSNQADMTFIGAGDNMKDNHATIVFDKPSKSYTILADGDLTVNNKSVKKKKLESGDVINVSGATIVFDEGDRDKDKKKGK